MNLSKVLSSVSQIIHDPILIDSAKIIPSSFSRTRKIPLSTLLEFLIFRHNQVLSEDVSCFFNLSSMPCKQALIKRMNILNFEVWNRILDSFISTVYPLLDFRLLDDLIVIAVDGSFADLPSHIALNHYFGGNKKRKDSTPEEIKKPQAKLSMIYDVKNKLILDFIIDKYDKSEIPLLFSHLERLEPFLRGKKVLLLADRYYGSTELFKYCEMHGYLYLVRGKINFFKKYVAERNEEDDFDIEVPIDKLWQKRIKHDDVRAYIAAHDFLNLRVIRNTYTYDQMNQNGKKKEISVNGLYFTNLSKEAFTRNEIVDIYHHDRWCIESAYDVLKNQLNIEQLNTHHPIGIINEIMGKVIFYNIEMLVQMESNKKIKEKDEQKYKYKTNNKNLINHLYTGDFISSFKKEKFSKRWIKQLIDKLSKERVAIRNGRHYKRWHKFLKSIPTAKHRIDGRRNPPVSITKNGILTVSH